MLREERLHLHYLQRVQALETTDFPQCVTFECKFLQQSILQPQYAASVLLTDESKFTQDGIFNILNNYLLDAVNTHGIRWSGRQQSFSVNV